MVKLAIDCFLEHDLEAPVFALALKFPANEVLTGRATLVATTVSGSDFCASSA